MRFRWARTPILILPVFLFCAGPAAAAPRTQDPPARDAKAPGAEKAPTSPEVLTLRQVEARVLEKNPALAAPRWEIEAAASKITQAGLRPNPEVTTQIENLAPRAPAGMFGLTETTLEVDQLIELGGKRRLRVQSAEAEQGVARSDLDLKRADLMAVAARAFADVLTAQRRVANQRELSALAGRAKEIVSERVAAGKVSPVEETRAEVALATARVEEEKQYRDLQSAKDRMAALWGGTQDDFSEVRGRFEIPANPRGLASPCIESNPAYRRAETVIESRRAAVDLEESSKVPDLTVSAGFRYLKEAGQRAWVAGVSIPIPFSDKRQGAIAEARIRLRKSLAEKEAVGWELRSALSRARHDHQSALEEARELETSALPTAQKAASLLEEGYRLGKFDYMDVLDAQRTYAELQRRHIEAVASGLKAAIEIERLAGCDSGSSLAPGSFLDQEAGHEK